MFFTLINDHTVCLDIFDGNDIVMVLLKKILDMFELLGRDLEHVFIIIVLTQFDEQIFAVEVVTK